MSVILLIPPPGMSWWGYPVVSSHAGHVGERWNRCPERERFLFRRHQGRSHIDVNLHVWKPAPGPSAGPSITVDPGHVTGCHSLAINARRIPMRRSLQLWALVAALLLSIVPASIGAFSQSTPEGPITNVPNPAVGDTISYVSDSGSEIARLRATEVILNWTDFSEYYVPSPGSQYVAIVVEVTNFGSRGNLIIRADDFRLQDVDGFFYSRSWADASETSELIPSESEIGVGSGRYRRGRAGLRSPDRCRTQPHLLAARLRAVADHCRSRWSGARRPVTPSRLPGC